MTYGLRVWNTQGVLTFDSTTDLTLFPQTEQFISGNSQVGQGTLSIPFPQFQGKKIQAFMMSPFGDYAYNGTPPVPAVLSCRVVYSNGTPVVQVFSDMKVDGLTGQVVPVYDGYLVVMLTGANQ